MLSISKANVLFLAYNLGLIYQLEDKFGVIGSKPLMLSLIVVRGRLLITLSTSVRNVDKTLSVNSYNNLRQLALTAFFVILIMDSSASPIHGAEGELIFHVIYL